MLVGKKTIVWRAFQVKWYDSYSWLHYDKANDVALWYLCKQATAEKKLMASKCSDEAFTSRGFAIGKMRRLHSHDTSKVSLTKRQCRPFSLCLAVMKTAEMLSSQHAKEKADSQHMLYKILSNVQFLARQRLPLCGSSQGDDSNITDPTIEAL